MLTSIVSYLGTCVGMYYAFAVSPWLTLALSLPAAGFLLRTFIVFHDCAHGPFMPWKRGTR